MPSDTNPKHNMTQEEIDGLCSLCTALLKKADLCTKAPYYITSFIPAIVTHSALIDKFNLFGHEVRDGE